MTDNQHLKGFRFFFRAIHNTRTEMWISLQVLVALTLLLAVLLYVVEHVAQPEVYSHLWDSIVWSFMAYLGNPGKFAPADPITLFGRVLWIIISLLKIALFAVPAGLIANGFRAAMVEDEKKRKNAAVAEKIRKSMYVHASLLNNVRFFPKDFYRFDDIRVNLDLNDNEIVEAVRGASDLRLRNMSKCLDGAQGNKPSQMAVEMMYMNRSYGLCSQFDYPDLFKSDSNVTLLCPNGAANECISYVTYQMARVGQFNVVINETLSSSADKDENRCIALGIYDYQYNDPLSYPKLHEYVDDIALTARNEEDWVIVLSRKAAPKEDVIHQKIRLVVSVEEATERSTIKDCNTVNDPDKVQAFYDDLCEVMSEKHGIEPTILYHTYKKTNIVRYIRERLGKNVNVIEIEMSRDYVVFGLDVKKPITSYKTLAEVIHRHFETRNTGWNTENWKADEIKQYRSKNIPAHIGEE